MSIDPSARYVTRPLRDWRLIRFFGWRRPNRLLGEISAVEPPDPIPNSEVKRSCADGSAAQAVRE